MAHPIFVSTTVGALILACLAGLVTAPPPEGAPSYALDSELVYRLAVAIAFFVSLYTAIVLVRLASRGLTPTKVGTTAVDLPQLFDSVGLVDTARGSGTHRMTIKITDRPSPGGGHLSEVERIRRARANLELSRAYREAARRRLWPHYVVNSAFER